MGKNSKANISQGMMNAIATIVEKAVAKAVAEMMESIATIAGKAGAKAAMEIIAKERKKERESRYDRRFGNTKLLLENYDDDLHLWSCQDIYIEEYIFHDPGEEVMDFGVALMNLKEGHRITRKGWNGKGMYVFLATDVNFRTEADLSEFNPTHTEECNELNAVDVGDMLVLRTAQGTLQPGWLASQADILAEDWLIL